MSDKDKYLTYENTDVPKIKDKLKADSKAFGSMYS